jgi:hypothetical protein
VDLLSNPENPRNKEKQRAVVSAGAAEERRNGSPCAGSATGRSSKMNEPEGGGNAPEGRTRHFIIFWGFNLLKMLKKRRDVVEGEIRWKKKESGRCRVAAELKESMATPSKILEKHRNVKRIETDLKAALTW